VCSSGSLARQNELQAIALTHLEPKAGAVEAPIGCVEQVPGHDAGRAELEAHLRESHDRCPRIDPVSSEGGDVSTDHRAELTGLG
jgi:hypothetical protein